MAEKELPAMAKAHEKRGIYTYNCPKATTTTTTTQT